MRGPRMRAFWVALAMIAIVAAGQVVLSTTPFELFRTVTPQERVIGLLLDGAWLIAVLALMLSQPSSQLWKFLLLWIAVGQIWLIGYLPVEPRILVDLPQYVLGDLWAAVFIHVILAYPSGRLVHRFDGRFVVFIYAFAIGFKFVALLVAPDECFPICANPIRLLPSTVLWDVVRYGAIALVPVLMVVALVELGRHWRQAGPAGRRALTPMVVAAPLWCVLVFAGYFADTFLDEAARDATHTSNVLGLTQALILPLAILIGVIQSRLARGNVARLAVELARGVPVGQLQAVLARAMRDPSLELAFPSPTGDGLVDPEGRPIAPDDTSRATTPIQHDGKVLAFLIDDPAIVAEDSGLVEAVGSVARLALENERLAAQVLAQLEEVRASRARIVEAADAERRRVERDLHDGAQQRLVALAMRLDVARQTNSASASLLDDATEELRAAVREVRDLARGLHPTILTEAGLGPAIEALAERASVPVTVEVPDRRFPPAIEAAAYFVVSEALTNVTRYAGASRVRVEVRAHSTTLRVSILDDGRGGADPQRGSGLRGLTDRVVALGGDLSIDSPPDGGTTVHADLPLPA